jgi:hypothetical protein
MASYRNESTSVLAFLFYIALLQKLISPKPRCNQQRLVLHFLARINDNVLLQ